MRSLLKLFFLVCLKSVAQTDFYILDGGELKTQDISISSDWQNLNLNEGAYFLQSNGFSEIEEKSYGEDMISVIGNKSINKNQHFARGINFLDKEAVSYIDIVTSRITCHSCLIDEQLKELSKNNEFFKEQYDKQMKEAILKDEENTRRIINAYVSKREQYNFEKLPDINKINNVEFTMIDDFNESSEEKFDYRQELYVQKNYIFLIVLSKTTVRKNQNIFTVSGVELKNISTFTLREMVEVFISDCLEHSIKINKQDIDAKFEQLEGDAIGLSYGIDNNEKVILKVDPAKWQKASKPKRWYILYHELGHDILNLNHGEGGKMMFNFSDKGYSWEEFYEDKEEMFKTFKKYN